MISSICVWLQENYQWIINLIFTGFITYHVYILSKKTGTKEKLIHQEKIKKESEDLAYEKYNKNLRKKVYIVNVDTYEKDYPDGENSHIHAEIKFTRFNGVQFFCSMPVGLYKRLDGELSFKSEGNKQLCNVYPVGLVPYEWIELIDPNGDEFSHHPLFYCKFKGKKNSPYKEINYYVESKHYQKSDPFDMKYKIIDRKIYRD